MQNAVYLLPLSSSPPVWDGVHCLHVDIPWGKFEVGLLGAGLVKTHGDSPVPAQSLLPCDSIPVLVPGGLSEGEGWQLVSA